jgi:hypothetical protein
VEIERDREREREREKGWAGGWGGRGIWSLSEIFLTP